ncbi:hypothetical protein C2S53_007910 [Perilla frutescens var. hirtella]|uniref:Uncharacterized protein n=1 Tax=Perilla frutescens var. hirtella TaxID=608512 RepID=A0AAD4P883_PERFH|nr:hypothetical protein C2S53_007910 [Perilla frutescens var. hirtella]
MSDKGPGGVSGRSGGGESQRLRKVEHDHWEFADDCFRIDDKTLLKEIPHWKRMANNNDTAATTTVEANAMAVSVTVGIQISPTTFCDRKVLSSYPSSAMTIVAANRSPLLQACLSFPDENGRLERENSELILELNRLRRENS